MADGEPQGAPGPNPVVRPQTADFALLLEKGMCALRNIGFVWGMKAVKFARNGCLKQDHPQLPAMLLPGEEAWYDDMEDDPDDD